MFKRIELDVVVLTVVGVFLIVRVIEWRVTRKWPPIKKALFSLKVEMIMMGVLLVVLIFSLPSTYYLESYGYPDQFKSVEEVHTFLRESNRVLLRMKEITYWLLLILTVGVLQSVYKFAKAIATSKVFDESTKQKILNLDDEN